jgi:hypothetical protein
MDTAKLTNGVDERKLAIEVLERIFNKDSKEANMPAEKPAELTDAMWTRLTGKNAVVKTVCSVILTELKERLAYGKALLGKELTASELAGLESRLGSIFDAPSRGAKIPAPNEGENVMDWLDRAGDSANMKVALKLGFRREKAADGVNWIFVKNTDTVLVKAEPAKKGKADK